MRRSICLMVWWWNSTDMQIAGLHSISTMTFNMSTHKSSTSRVHQGPVPCNRETCSRHYSQSMTQKIVIGLPSKRRFFFGSFLCSSFNLWKYEKAGCFERCFPYHHTLWAAFFVNLLTWLEIECSMPLHRRIAIRPPRYPRAQVSSQPILCKKQRILFIAHMSGEFCLDRSGAGHIISPVPHR